jgi:hypothetical protein
MKTKHRFIKNGPVVVDIATKSYPSLIGIRHSITIKVKTIARVNTESGDVYNAEVGEKLAALRAEVKLAKKYNRILEDYKKYFLKQVNPTIENSLQMIDKSSKELNDYLSTL